MDLLIVKKRRLTLLKMLDPVLARVLKLCRQALLYTVPWNLICTGIWRMQATYISFEVVGHKLQAAMCKGPVRLSFLHPIRFIMAPLLINEKVAKGRMQ